MTMCEQQKDVTESARAGNNRFWFRRCMLLLGMMIAWGGAMELGARLLIPKISRIESRVVAERRLAVAPPAIGKTNVLLLGNSLLNADVDLEALRAGMGSAFLIRRFVVEQTGYWDWYFGIRRLLDEGARPDVIILMLGRHDLLSDSIRGDYFAHRLMGTRDVFRVASDLKLHPTTAANLLAANLSAFYGLRSEIRKVLMGKLMPDVPLFIHNLTMTHGGETSPLELSSRGCSRLSALKATCAEHQARLVFILAPEPRSNEPIVAPFKEAMAACDVSVVLAMQGGQLKEAEFTDGYHMNQKGARRYTEALVPELEKIYDKHE